VHHSDAEIAVYLASFVTTTALTIALLVRDERRLTPERRERAWDPVSRASAIAVSMFLLPGVCLPVHYWRTRRSFGGTLLGVLLMALVIGSGMLAALGTAAAFGLDLDDL
jgi:hypothetical protein